MFVYLFEIHSTYLIILRKENLENLILKKSWYQIFLLLHHYNSSSNR